MYFALLCLVVALSVAVFLGGRRRRTRRHARALEIVQTEAEKHGWSEARQAAEHAHLITKRRPAPSAFVETISPSDAMADTYIPGGGGPQTYNETISEAVTAADSLASAGTFPNALSEAVIPGDSATSGVRMPLALSEAITLADSTPSAFTGANPLTEAVALADALSSAATFRNAVGEAISPADSMPSGLVHGGGNVYNESFTEPLNLGGAGN